MGTATFSMILVDDNRVFRSVFKKVLEQYPQINSVKEAETADELFEIIKHAPADIITMDTSLPGLDSFEATKKLLRHNPSTKVIMISVHDTPEYRKLAKEAGALAYIVKHDLVEKLDDVLKLIFRESKII